MQQAPHHQQHALARRQHQRVLPLVVGHRRRRATRQNLPALALVDAQVVWAEAAERGEGERDGLLLLEDAGHERRVARVVAYVQQRAAANEGLNHLGVVLVDGAEERSLARSSCWRRYAVRRVEANTIGRSCFFGNALITMRRKR